MLTAGTNGRLSVAATLLVLTAAATVPDQYEQQSDTRLPPLHTGIHRFGFAKSPQQPDLQVGCADGSVNMRPNHQEVPIQVMKNWISTRRKRQAENLRQKRDYIHWYGIRASYPEPHAPQNYQIQSAVPYWVPIWGNPRRIPVFFPAKPILFNPGYPIRNRPGTVNNSPTTTTDVPVSIGSRINVNEAGEPIWGIVEPEFSVAAAPAQPPKPQKPKTPPLFHKPSLADRDIVTQAPSVIQEIAQSPPQQLSPQASAQQTGRQEPNRCVWAIISCCSPTSQQVRHNCFEQLGCPGAFWDRNPCSKEVTAAALNAAQKFYEQS